MPCQHRLTSPAKTKALPQRGSGSRDLPALSISVIHCCKFHLHSSVFSGAVSEGAAHATACGQQLAEEVTLVPASLSRVSKPIPLLLVVLPVCKAAFELCLTLGAACRHFASCNAVSLHTQRQGHQKV